MPDAAPPELATPSHSETPTSRNRLREEHCPAVLDAARLGIVVRTASNHEFRPGHEYRVNVFSGADGSRIYDPCLVGSDEHDAPFLKFATGLWVSLSGADWLLTPPLDPRLRIPGTTGSHGVLRNGFTGPLFVVLRADRPIQLNSGTIIGQLIPLTPTLPYLAASPPNPKHIVTVGVPRYGWNVDLDRDVNGG